MHELRKDYIFNRWVIVNTERAKRPKDFIKQPVLGYGITGYSFIDAQYPRILIETGILGLIAFLALIFSIYKHALSTYRNTSDPFFSGVSLGYLAGFVAMLVHSIGTNIFVIVRIMEPFWFLTAIIIMIPTIEAGEVGADIPVKS